MNRHCSMCDLPEDVDARHVLQCPAVQHGRDHMMLRVSSIPDGYGALREEPLILGKKSGKSK